MELLRRLLRWLNGRPDKVMYIGGSDTLPPPLPRQEEAEWIARLERGELLARQTLIERNLRLVVYIARRFENTGINIEDLISIGTIGLIKAINTFRADKNIKLATYASRCIENEILMYLRKNSAQRTEVSFDEPLNTDWDGKELLLSDVLGTDGDVVMGPIGLLCANALMGEVSPALAAAVSSAPGRRILIPMSSCGVLVAGTGGQRMEELLHDAVELAAKEAGL